MKKIFALVTFFLCIFTVTPPVQASGEWSRYNQAEQLTRAGNDHEALPIWKQLVYDMQHIGQNEAAGFCAQYAGRILDKMGNYQEAVKYYRIEAGLWDPLPKPGSERWSEVDKSRADTLNPIIELYVEKPAEPNYPLGKFEPSSGIIYGATTLRDPALGPDQNYQQVVTGKYGKPYSGILGYINWGDLPSVSPEFLQAKSSNVMLQIAWQLTAGLNAVQDDEYLHSFARELREYGKPLFLSFGREMNGDWVVWGGNPLLYKQKYQLVSSVMKREAPNVAMVWTPGYVPSETVDDYYPGDAWVDWVGINGYTDYYCNGNPNMDKATAEVFYQGSEANPLTKFKAIYDRYSGRKPIMIGETGVAWANRRPYVEVTDWAVNNIKRFYGYLPLAYPRIKAVYYFNVDQSTSDFSHYLVSGNPKLEKAFREAISSPVYLSDYSKNSPVAYQPASHLPDSGALACYIPSGPINASKVSYFVNGREIGTSYFPPWRVTYQLGQISNGAEIQVVAYDHSGAGVLNAAFTANVGASVISGGNTASAPDAAAIRIVINGQTILSDVPPIIKNSRTLVPVRVVSEALGASVEWLAESQTVLVKKAGTTVKLKIGDHQATINEQMVSLDMPAEIIENRTMIPLRFVSESLGTQVDWDSETKTVYIES